MKQMEVTDELLYQYMPIADEMDLDALEAEIADEEIVLSKKFERRMKRLMWKEEHKWVAGFGKFMAKVAVVLLCVLGVSLAVTMSVDAYRSKFFQTVQEIWEDSVVHTYDIGEEGQEFVPHEPSYIPEGYEEVSRVDIGHMRSIIYENAGGNIIVWDQKLVLESGWHTTDDELEAQEYIKLNDGIMVVTQYDVNQIGAYYEKQQYVYIITADNLQIDELSAIFNSIE